MATLRSPTRVVTTTVVRLSAMLAAEDVCGEAVRVSARQSVVAGSAMAATWAYGIVNTDLLAARGAPIGTLTSRKQYLLAWGGRLSRERFAFARDIWRCARQWRQYPPRSFPLVALWEDFPALAGPFIERRIAGRCPCIFVTVLGAETATAWFHWRRASEPADWITDDCWHAESAILR